ncbi:MAG: preprotein translocase subunit SecY [Clostridia bacterium]|nr:preprotein translocase subunit SecY [Clostridia bacterium]
MFKTFVNAFKQKEVRNKLLLTLLLLFIYCVGCWLPLPGLDIKAFNAAIVGDDGNGFLALLSAISGGALANGAILALGVSPYITASIIIQLLTIAIPALEKLSKEGGEAGRKKINLITRWIALGLSFAQAIGIVLAFQNLLNPDVLGAGTSPFLIGAMTVIMLTAGGMFTVWIGERITDLGIGNGMSMLIFVGILSTAVSSILNTVMGIGSDPNFIWNILIFIVALLLIFVFIVFMDLSERRIPVQYAKQVKGRKMYGGQSTYIPVKLNTSGVMPIIFANALVMFPQLISSIFWPESTWYQNVLGTNSWLYIILTALLILFFAYFYAQITFNTEDISRRIQQNGGFIPGIRPGKPTTEYLKRVSNRLILFGAIFLSIVALVPSLIFKGIDITSSGSLVSAFSATGLLIIVSVALDFEKRLDAQLMMRTYKGFLK